MRKSFIPAVIFLSLSLGAGAQELDWLAGFDGFLDNREYFSIDDPQTMFGSRLRLEAGASLAGVHRFHAGIDYLYEFGHYIDARKPAPVLYYGYDNGKLKMYFGAFPGRDLLDYPLALLSDTLRYYRPNIEGALLACAWSWGEENAFIDWTSRQTDTAPERFIFGFSGKAVWKFLSLSHHFMMGHMAGPAVPVPGEHLRDNGGFDVSLGADLSDMVFADSLLLSAGALVSVDRIRSVDEGFRIPAGFLGRFSVVHRGAGLSGLYYAGEGHVFLYGDPFYRLRNYARLDVFFEPLRTGPVRIRFDVGFHLAESQVDYSQQVAVTMIMDGSRPRR